MIILLSFSPSFFAREARNVRSLRFVFPIKPGVLFTPFHYRDRFIRII